MFVKELGLEIDFNKQPYRGCFKEVAKKENVSAAAIRQSYMNGNPKRVKLVHDQIQKNMNLISTKFPEFFNVAI